MGASLTRLCFLYTLPHHTKAPSVSYTRARAIHRIRTLRYCLVCLSSSAFLSLFTSFPLFIFQYSLTTCECSAFLSLLLTQSEFSLHPDCCCSRSLLLSSPTPSYHSLLSSRDCTCAVSCSISCRRFFRSSVFTQQHELLLLQQPSHTHTFFL